MYLILICYFPTGDAILLGGSMFLFMASISPNL